MAKEKEGKMKENTGIIRKKLKEFILNMVMNGNDSHVKKEGTRYTVKVQNFTFTCSYTDDEIEHIVDDCILILEELQEITSNGYTREMLEEARKTGKEKCDDTNGSKIQALFKTIDVYNSFSTPRLEELVDDIAVTARVGGAWFMLLSRPAFIDAIFAVYEIIIDKFDDEKIYLSSLDFLVRNAMRMHSDNLT